MANIDRAQLQQLSDVKLKEQVNHPDHYNQGKIEVDVCSVTPSQLDTIYSCINRLIKVA